MNGLSDWHAPRGPEVRLTDRALRFVQAPCEAALSASVVVGISHRNQPDLLRRALLSVMRQDMPAGSVVESGPFLNTHQFVFQSTFFRE